MSNIPKILVAVILTVSVILFTGCASRTSNPNDTSCFTGTGGGVWGWLTGAVAYKTITLPNGINLNNLNGSDIIAIEKVLCVQNPEDTVERLLAIIEANNS